MSVLQPLSHNSPLLGYTEILIDDKITDVGINKTTDEHEILYQSLSDQAKFFQLESYTLETTKVSTKFCVIHQISRNSPLTIGLLLLEL